MAAADASRPTLAAVCPRCGGAFDCGANNVAATPCACSSLQLSAGLLQRLRVDYPAGCLCLRCLVALQAADAHAHAQEYSAERAPPKDNTMKASP